jgi:hypothetical protein
MKLLFIASLATVILCGCNRDNIHEEVEKGLTNRIISTNQPALGTDPNVRQDWKQGQGEVTTGNSPGSSANSRSADTQGGGSKTGAGGAGPGYRGDLTNAPRK